MLRVFKWGAFLFERISWLARASGRRNKSYRYFGTAYPNRQTEAQKSKGDSPLGCMEPASKI